MILPNVTFFFRLTTEFNNFVQLCDKEKAKNEELSKQNEEIVSAKSQLQNDLKLLQEKLEKLVN